MLDAFRQLAEKWLLIPPEPEPPPGDEATARVFRAAPQYLKYLRVLWVVRTGVMLLIAGMPLVVGLVAFLAVGRGRAGGMAGALFIVAGLIILSLIVAFALFSLAVIHLDFEKRWYVVTDRSLRIREGVMTVREITFTFANIQNLSVTQGPIQRALGIADLKVETAGGGSGGGHPQHQALANLHTAYFRGIDNAGEVKQLIATRMRGVRDAGLGDAGDEESMVTTGALSAPPVIAALQAVLAEAKALRSVQEAAGVQNPG